MPEGRSPCTALRAYIGGLRKRIPRRESDMRTSRLAKWPAALALVVALGTAGCGGGSSDTPTSTSATRAPGSWSTAVCKQVARAVAREGKGALAHYRPPLSNYPPDVALLTVRLSVGGLKGHHCPPAIAGEILARRLSAKQRAELFTHLPPGVVRYLRRGLAEM